MKTRVLLIAAILFTSSILVGCSSGGATETSSTEPAKSSNYLDLWNDEIALEGKADFETLVLDKDDFTKEAYYYLPKNERIKAARNLIQYDFFLHKSSDSDVFIPSVSVTYGGDEWLFMEDAIFKINDDVMNFSPAIDPFRDTFPTGGVFEALFFELSKDELNFLGNSKSISDLDIRMNTTTFEEMKLNALEYAGMRKILSSYRYYLSTQK